MIDTILKSDTAPSVTVIESRWNKAPYWAVALVLAAIVLATHFTSFQTGMTDYDDWLAPNLSKFMFHGWESFFGLLDMTLDLPPRMTNFLPTTTLALVWHFSGREVWLMQASVLVAHFCAALFLFGLLSRLGFRKVQALAGSALFAAGPWSFEFGPVTANMDWAMVTALMLLSISWFVDFVQGKSFWFYVASLLVYLLALLCREIAILLPAVLGSWLILNEKTRGEIKKNIMILIPFAAAGAAWFLAMFLIPGMQGTEDGERILNPAVSARDLSGSFRWFMGVAQGLLQPNPGTGHGTLIVLAGSMLAGVIAVLCVYSLLKLGTAGSWFLTAWVAIFVLPLVFVQGGYEDMEARLFYPASAGICGLAGIGAASVRAWSKLGGLACVILVSASGFLTNVYERGFAESQGALEKYVGVVQAMANTISPGQTVFFLESEGIDAGICELGAAVTAASTKWRDVYVYVVHKPVRVGWCDDRRTLRPNDPVFVLFFRGLNPYRADLDRAASYLVVGDEPGAAHDCIMVGDKGPGIAGVVVRFSTHGDLLRGH